MSADWNYDRLSRISCWRSGILSMDRVISRTDHGKGLRRYTLPSLPISTSMKPRGRSFPAQRGVERRAVGVGQDHHVTQGEIIEPLVRCMSICWRISRVIAGLSAKHDEGAFEST